MAFFLLMESLGAARHTPCRFSSHLKKNMFDVWIILLAGRLFLQHYNLRAVVKMGEPFPAPSTWSSTLSRSCRPRSTCSSRTSSTASKFRMRLMPQLIGKDFYCAVSKRVLDLRTWSLIRTFLAFWVLNGSLFIFQGPYFHCFGFIHAKNVNSVCMYTTMVPV